MNKKANHFKSLADEALLDLIQQGDRAAFEEIVCRYRNKIHRLAMGFMRSEQDAEEIAQEVFMRLFQKAESFEGKSAFSSWLYKIALNATYMKMRERKAATLFSLDEMAEQLEEILEPPDDSVSQPEEELITAEAMEIIEEAMEALPYEFKSVVILRDIEGFTNEEVGEILDLSVPAVKSRLHRARLFLRKKLDEYYRQNFPS